MDHILVIKEGKQGFSDEDIYNRDSRTDFHVVVALMDGDGRNTRLIFWWCLKA